VIANGVEFLVRSVRADGSWPIDTNLTTWVTTLAVNALAAAGDLDSLDKTDELRDWLLRQQYTERHPYTGADPGGWSWTDLPGGVPDADDTPGALLALANLNSESSRIPDSGIEWLTGLQNSDGGWPTFCRGWGQLPFDRSGSDLTAHAIRAIERCRHTLWRDGEIPLIGIGQLSVENVQYYINSGLKYLARHQRPDGSWPPLWFGNQYVPDDENPTYGTARVLAAYRDLGLANSGPARRGVAWLLANQNDDGGWGGGRGTPSSVEETALAVEVLVGWPDTPHPNPPPQGGRGPEAPTTFGPLPPCGGGLGWGVIENAVHRGLAWLVCKVEAGGLYNPTPIGFYFAKLWYFERLYPIIFSVAALGRACRALPA
jgi:squalene-hopene/tetraprenyl-beta-curcumene cyclase